VCVRLFVHVSTYDGDHDDVPEKTSEFVSLTVAVWLAVTVLLVVRVDVGRSC